MMVLIVEVKYFNDKLVDRSGSALYNISHCDGLFLCVTNDNDNDNYNNYRLVVWNPCNGQTRWIKPRNSYNFFDRYSLGYEKKENNSLRNHKVLRFMDNYNWCTEQGLRDFEIYSLNSDSWKVVHLNPDWYIESDQRGVSLKGDTFWFAREKFQRLGVMNDFLLCFDFTNDKFGPRLPLPFSSSHLDTVALSSVREDQLAVLFQRCGTSRVEIWISDKIEHDAVSWRNCFLAVDMMKPLTPFKLQSNAASFLVDEKKNVAVVLDKDNVYRPTRDVAYIIGKEGYLETVDLGGSTNEDCPPLVCSYVPSSVQIKQAGP
ncbi:unnamed protein product [Microthlaspi erraticum]|uniref:F-box associated beta-propeller type 1 domain-containing protein n=1 Tax=Microthlaspi erraticum TaxID=1685480 RepID=A0A6D2HQ68_9BRAS|nr:unnamed protein product [Microthlaspi erraticum]